MEISRRLLKAFKWVMWITEDEYDIYYQSLREKVSDLDTRLVLLQEAEDNYYVTAKYLLELVNLTYDLFLSSELEERRQLVNRVLQNLKIDNKKLVYVAQKPFDTLLNCSDNKLWLPALELIRTAVCGY